MCDMAGQVDFLGIHLKPRLFGIPKPRSSIWASHLSHSRTRRKLGSRVWLLDLVSVPKRYQYRRERNWVKPVEVNLVCALDLLSTQHGPYLTGSGYILLGIIEQEEVHKNRGKGKQHKKSGKVLVEFKIRKGKARLQWFAKSYLPRVFDSDQVKVAKEQWEARKEENGDGLQDGEASEQGAGYLTVPR